MVTPKQANADITSIKKEGEKEKRGKGGRWERVQNEYFKKKRGVKSFVTGQTKTMERTERGGRTGDDVNNNQEDREPRQSKD